MQQVQHTGLPKKRVRRTKAQLLRDNMNEFEKLDAPPKLASVFDLSRLSEDCGTTNGKLCGGRLSKQTEASSDSQGSFEYSDSHGLNRNENRHPDLQVKYLQNYLKKKKQEISKAELHRL